MTSRDARIKAHEIAAAALTRHQVKQSDFLQPVSVDDRRKVQAEYERLTDTHFRLAHLTVPR